MAKSKLDKQADEIMRLAEEGGVRSNFFFRTTFQRYLVQVNNAAELEKIIKKSDATVTKEYVKGRQNIYVNPAYAEYNKTTDSANKTVNTLLKIIREFKVGDGEEQEEDPLVKLINGDDEDE